MLAIPKETRFTTFTKQQPPTRLETMHDKSPGPTVFQSFKAPESEAGSNRKDYLLPSLVGTKIDTLGGYKQGV